MSRAEASGGTCSGRGEGVWQGTKGADADAQPTASPLTTGLGPRQCCGVPSEWPRAPYQLHGNRAWSSGPQSHRPGQCHLHYRCGLELCTAGQGRFKGGRMGLVFIFSSHFPLTGLEAPQDLEAKEVTPRTALLTWTEPQVLPTGYLLSFNTPGEQTQVPPSLPHWPAPLPASIPGGAAPSSGPPSGAPCPMTCSLSVHRRSCSQEESPRTGCWASFPPPPTACGSGLCGARASHRRCPPPSPLVFGPWDIWPGAEQAAGVWGLAKGPAPHSPLPRWTSNPLSSGLWGRDAERSQLLEGHHHLPEWEPRAAPGCVL